MFYHTIHLQLFSVAILLLRCLREVHAQNGRYGDPTIASCTLTADYAWAANTFGNDPCNVAGLLLMQTTSPCNDAGYSIAPLGSNPYYEAPYAPYANQCLCNTVIYSLISACSLCQDKSYSYFSLWIENCPANETLYQVWPAAVNSTVNAIPTWAYIPLYNDAFNPNLASINATATTIPVTSGTVVVISTSYSTPSTTISPFPSPTTFSSSAKPTQDAGTISAEVIGGVAGVALLAFIFIFLWRRRHRSKQSEYQPATKAETGEQEYYDRSSTALSGLPGPRNSLAKLYNPSPFTPASSPSNSPRTYSGFYSGAPEPMTLG